MPVVSFHSYRIVGDGTLDQKSEKTLTKFQKSSQHDSNNNSKFVSSVFFHHGLY